MILKIGNKKIDFYNGVTVSLQYDSVASVFSFSFYFDPANAEHREIFRPCSYAQVTIEHEGELLITGTLLSPSFQDGPVQEVVTVSGYSKTGVLEDCEIPTSAYPLQSNGLSLEEITRKVIRPFGLNLVVDAGASAKAGAAYKTSTASDAQTAKGYLAELSGQRHLMLTHDERGNLVITQARTNAAPVHDFTSGMPGTRMSLDVDCQRMHSTIGMIKQQTKGRKDGSHKKGNAGQAEVTNPYVPVFRPKVNRQTSGEIVDTGNAARNMLSDELKGIVLKIEIDRWTLGGKIIRPNSIITVTNPNLYLFKKTRFFIAGVEYRGDHNSETATLTCHLPEVFNGETPKNIFT